jgi:very-short-patch-repair endonuclease
MRSKGISVMRFTNQEVTNSTVAVVALIKDRILKRLA